MHPLLLLLLPVFVFLQAGRVGGAGGAVTSGEDQGIWLGQQYFPKRENTQTRTHDVADQSWYRSVSMDPRASPALPCPDPATPVPRVPEPGIPLFYPCP